MSFFFKPTEYNGDTKNQMWLTLIGDSHDIYCGCDKPYAHLLNLIFPEGHTDRDKSIAEIISRDSTCHFGGQEEEDHGIPVGGSAATFAGDIQKGVKEEEDIEGLIAAAMAAEENER